MLFTWFLSNFSIFLKISFSAADLTQGGHISRPLIKLYFNSVSLSCHDDLELVIFLPSPPK